MQYRLRTLLILLIVGPMVGCFAPVGGGTGDGESDEVIYYPPGPEFRKTQNGAEMQPTSTP